MIKLITVTQASIAVDVWGRGKEHRRYRNASQASYDRLAQTIARFQIRGHGWVRPFLAGVLGYVYEYKETVQND